MLQTNTQVDCSKVSIDDLLPENTLANLTVTRLLFSAAATNYSSLIPSPSYGYTLLVTQDEGFSKPSPGAPFL